MSFTPPVSLDHSFDQCLKKIYNNSGLYCLPDIKKLFTIDNLQDFLYEKNRPINDDKVYMIIEHEKKYKKKYGTYDYYMGKINIATVNCKDMKIIDGQHRAKSALLLEGEVFCEIVITDYKTEEDRFDAYLAINQNTPVDEFYKTADQAVVFIIIESVKIIKNIYHKSFSESRNPYRPNVNADTFCERLNGFLTGNKYKHYLNLKDTHDSVKRVTSAILDYNQHLIENKSVQFFPKYSGTLKRREIYYNKALANEFVLGMYNNYEWFSSAFRKGFTFKRK